MAKKTVGYVELEWICSNCGNKNPGLKKSCGACGSPQPETTRFELGQERDMIKDAQKEAIASKGPDIHCPFCGTRNGADAQLCVQCGGDLKEGLKRESGRVISGQPAKAQAEIKCPNCATVNPPGSNTCSACGAPLAVSSLPTPPAEVAKTSRFRPWMALPVVAILALCCIVFGFLFFRTTSLVGVVQNATWQRSIPIEAQREVTKEDWRDQLPGGAQILSCQQEYRSRQDNPVEGAREICSTELVDQGNGSAKVLETCYYEVYADKCEYKALEWQKVDEAVARGTDLQPYWPQVNLLNGQREGKRSESYSIYFSTKDGIKQFNTTNAALYAQLQPGSQWTLKVNTLGAVVEVSP